MIHLKWLWGRRGVLAAVVLTAMMAAGCKGGQDQSAGTSGTETSTQAQTTPGTGTQADAGAQSGAEGQGMPNPMEEVKDVLAFEAIGVHMILPEDAADTSFFIISGQVADARFTLDGVSYTYRASDTAEDFAGIFERFKEDVITQVYDYGEESVEALIKTTESGGRLASWAWGTTKYTLYTASAADDGTVTDLTMKLVELSQYEK